ncbi:MAG: LysR family transcriptional regulator [Verrucomicrobiota bacterium]
MIAPFDVKQIRYFLHVARTGNVNKASRELEISQPALTRQIQVLEESLNRRLFHRTPFGVELTEAGVAFRGGCKSFMQLHRRAANSIDAQRRRQNRAIVVGLSGSVMSPMASITSILADIPRFQPHCDINFIGTGTDRVGMEMLRAKEIDLLLRCRVAANAESHDFSVDSVLLTSVVALAPSGHGPMAMKELEKKDIFVLEFGDEQELRKTVIRACEENGAEPNTVTSTKSELSFLGFATQENRVGIRIGHVAGSAGGSDLRPVRQLELDHPPRFEVMSRLDDSNPMVEHVRAFHRRHVFSLLR